MHIVIADPRAEGASGASRGSMSRCWRGANELRPLPRKGRPEIRSRLLGLLHPRYQTYSNMSENDVRPICCSCPLRSLPRCSHPAAGSRRPSRARRPLTSLACPRPRLALASTRPCRDTCRSRYVPSSQLRPTRAVPVSLYRRGRHELTVDHHLAFPPFFVFSSVLAPRSLSPLRLPHAALVNDM